MASPHDSRRRANWRKMARNLLLTAIACVPAPAFAQLAGELPSATDARKVERPAEATLMKETSLIEEVIDPELIFRVEPARSRVVRTRLPVKRVAITDPTVVEINEFTPSELEVIGLKAGETTVTIWFQDDAGQTRRLRYLVQVAANESEQQQAASEFSKLQARINELFPNSQVQLFPVADKLVIRGQARDSREAAEILALVGGQIQNQGGQNGMNQNIVGAGQVARLPGAPQLQFSQVVNLMNVPGEQQVMLKVRVAEISRTALRDLGVRYGLDVGNWGMGFAGFAGAANISAILNDGDYFLMMKAFSSNAYSKILAEPTLITLNGQPATFLAGGEFAVPVTVGVEGASAVANVFRSFGTAIVFTPHIIDKDKIRLQVMPTLSTRNNENDVNGIPGLNTRTVSTTVDLREGQWLAIAGLIQDHQKGERSRIPFIGDIPVLGAAFGSQAKKREETEMVVLVSPELIHPLEREQAPALLPGMEVTDPTDIAFFFRQQIEGPPSVMHRSTLWPSARQKAVIEGHRAAQGQRKATRTFVDEESFYVNGPSGLSE